MYTIMSRSSYDNLVATLGRDHIDTAKQAQSLGVMLMYQTTDQEEAVRLLREAHSVFRSRIGPDAQETLICGLDLGVVLIKLGHWKEAAGFLWPVHVRYANDHRVRLVSAFSLGMCMIYAQLTQDAEIFLREAHALRHTHLGRSHFLTCEAAFELGALLQALHKWPESESILRPAYDAFAARNDMGNRASIGILLGIACEQQGREAEAERLMRESFETHMTMNGADSAVTAKDAHHLGVLLAKRAGDDPSILAEAERCLRIAHAVRKCAWEARVLAGVIERRGEPHPELDELRRFIADAMQRTIGDCIVCYEVKQLARIEPCGHVNVCETCIGRWSQQHATCPMCRQHINRAFIMRYV